MFKMDHAFPRILANIPANIDSALYLSSNKRMIFIKVGSRNNTIFEQYQSYVCVSPYYLYTCVITTAALT